MVNKNRVRQKFHGRKLEKKPTVASHAQQKLIKTKQYLENIVWYLILRMILTTIWNVLIFFVSAKNKFITIDLVTETFSLFDIIMLLSSIKDKFWKKKNSLLLSISEKTCLNEMGIHKMSHIFKFWFESPICSTLSYYRFFEHLKSVILLKQTTWWCFRREN